MLKTHWGGARDGEILYFFFRHQNHTFYEVCLFLPENT